MDEAVKGVPARPPTRREQQARQTRRAIVDAARALFLADGFSATTMPAIADRAGVAVQTVYKNFRNKPNLAKAVFDVAIAGDDDEPAVVDREALGRVRNEPDPHRMLQLYGEFLATVGPRHVPVQLVIRDAAANDADAAAVWNQLQHERLVGMTMFAQALSTRGALRDGVTADDARDTLWTYNSAELYQLLVIQRRWPPERYGQWIANALIAALL